MIQQSNLFQRFLPVVTIILGLSACDVDPDVNTATAAAPQSQATAAPTPARTVQAKAPVTPRENRGTVESVELAAGYSYLQVDVQGDKFWMATSVSSFKPGERIVWKDHAVMTNFTSKALGRSFDQILFVDRIVAESALQDSQHHGTVVEAMSAAGYSYIQVRENDKMVWLAAPQTQLSAGQKIRWTSGAPMLNFTSQSLNRKFDEIFFVSSVAQTS